jgi:hypothetical protein
MAQPLPRVLNARKIAIPRVITNGAIAKSPSCLCRNGLGMFRRYDNSTCSHLRIAGVRSRRGASGTDFRALLLAEAVLAAAHLAATAVAGRSYLPGSFRKAALGRAASLIGGLTAT